MSLRSTLFCWLALAAVGPLAGICDAGPPALPAASGAAPDSPPADLTLGGEKIFTLKATANGQTPSQRMDDVYESLNRVLATPDILPSDTVVYAPHSGDIAIYVLGRKLVSVYSGDIEPQSNGATLQTAVFWAKRLQVVLPQVDIRIGSHAAPSIPVNPDLTVTSILGNVGGNIGIVDVNSRTALVLIDSADPALTPAEYADRLGAHLEHVIDTTPGIQPSAFQVQPLASDPAGPVQITVLGQPLMTVTPGEAADDCAVSAAALAAGWVQSLQALLGPRIKPEPFGPHSLPGAHPAPPGSGLAPTAPLPDNPAPGSAAGPGPPAQQRQTDSAGVP